MRWGVFLDKDGTLLENVPFNVDPQRMRFAPGVPRGLRLLGSLSVPLIVVSNQPGVALARFALADLEAVEQRLREMFEPCGASLAGFYFCPHHPEASDARYAGRCTCRKPAAGLLRRAAREHGLTLDRCWMIGDILDDIEAGRRARCHTILVDAGGETGAEWDPLRIPDQFVPDFEKAALVVATAARSGGLAFPAGARM